MSSEYPTSGMSWGSAIGGSAALPQFPGEKPSFKMLKQWLESTKSTLEQTIYGPALRGEYPPHLVHLTIKRDDGINALSAEDRAKAGPLEIARFDQMVAKARMDEDIRIKQLAIGEREYKNKLAALLQSALRPKAGLLLKKLLGDHKDAIHDTYDGVMMWKALAALELAPSTFAERREHDRAIESARDSVLPDGCAAQDFADKINNLLKDHLPYGTHSYEKEKLGLFIFELLPFVNGAEKRQAIRELTADGTLGDADIVLARCTEIVRASATNVHTPVAAVEPDMRMLQVALAKAGVDAAVIANFTATLNKQGKQKARAGGKTSGKDEPNKFRLPEGQKCSKGTCTLNHDKFSPGTPCFRDPGFGGPPPKNYRNNAKQIQRLEEARKANAVRMGVPYKPMLLSTPPAAAAAVAIADDVMDAMANDVFQLPASLCPVLPVFGAAIAGPVCAPAAVRRHVAVGFFRRRGPFRRVPDSTGGAIGLCRRARIISHAYSCSRWTDGQYSRIFYDVRRQLRAPVAR